MRHLLTIAAGAALLAFSSASVQADPATGKDVFSAQQCTDCHET